ncbi:helix-turn-helix domain-containing protein [Nonomuraea sp. NPDC050022]|uniref:helix-turn-helix domain-containing protein n=1 Tax=Nonomuraea sp. NPDC050022 TaxID=3364358 RepID=UPI0037A7B824
MPGGRLTYADRQRIAAGLAEGLGYSDIARRLARPTSTITREVGRNGGPHAYRAAAAQAATARRARRSKPAPRPAEPIAAETPYGRDPEAVRAFEDRFMAMMVQTGLPPMMAAVLVHLFTSDTGGLTAAELIQRLRVSPASISKAVGYLERLGLVRREREGRRRRERYIVHDDIWYRTWSASARSIQLWAGTAQEGVGVLGAATPAGARLDMTSRYFQLLGGDMAKAAENRWRALSATRPGSR